MLNLWCLQYPLCFKLLLSAPWIIVWKYAYELYKMCKYFCHWIINNLKPNCALNLSSVPTLYRIFFA